MTGGFPQVILRERLRDLRGRESQGALIERLRATGWPVFQGLKQQTYSAWETGASVPDLPTVVGLAAFWRVSLDELVTGSSPYGSPTLSREAAEELARWLRLFSPKEGIGGG